MDVRSHVGPEFLSQVMSLGRSGGRSGLRSVPPVGGEPQDPRHSGEDTRSEHASLSPTVRWLFGQLLAPVETIASIRREAVLAERAALDHSVVVLEVTDPRIDARPARQVVLAARRAMLDGDELGWLDATRIALSLPLTGPTAAAVTAARIAAEGGPMGWLVYSQLAMPEGRGGDEQTDAGVRPIAELLRDPLPAWKRLIDIVGALALLVLTLPALVLGGVLVRLSSPGPVIFRQRRAGLHGQPFVLFKFRTMIDGAEAMKPSLLRFNELKGAIFKMKNDPRVTRIGRFLRITSIDELPQLWNVLRGEMSLVGPRPPTLDEVSCYRAWHRRRLSVRPGITGLWQVSARECNDFDHRVRMDLRYIERRSLLGDLRLLSATVPSVLSRRGAM